MNLADLKSFIASSRLFAVIFGGAGCEHEISCKSAGSIIITARACGYALLPVGISRSGDFYIYLGEDEKIADGSCFDDERNLVPSFPVRIGGERGFYTSEGIVTVCWHLSPCTAITVRTAECRDFWIASEYPAQGAIP